MHLEKLSPGTTMCPGRLARQCGVRLSNIREELISLYKAEKIQIMQGGKMVKADQLRGPFRVRLTPR